MTSIEPSATYLMCAAEPNRLPGGAPGERNRHRIVRVQHRHITLALRLEQPRLGAGIGVEGMMPVQMILRNVQTSRDGCMKSPDRLQLKARELQHIELTLPR